MLLSLFIPLWSLQWTNAASNNHDPKRFKMLLTFGLRGAGSGRGSELVWLGLDRGDVEDVWCWTFEAWAVLTCYRSVRIYPHSRKIWENTRTFLNGRQLKKSNLHSIITEMKTLTALVFMVALFTVTARCLRLCGGVVLTAVLWGILNLFTGVGGALSDRGLEMPFKKKTNSYSSYFHTCGRKNPPQATSVKAQDRLQQIPLGASQYPFALFLPELWNTNISWTWLPKINNYIFKLRNKMWLCSGRREVGDCWIGLPRNPLRRTNQM